MKFVLASSNAGKIKEFKEEFKNDEILSLKDVGFDEEIEETGKTFYENAKIKALAVHNFLKKQGKEYSVIADDSGLCVNALNGEPGVYSARYGGDHNKDASIKKLLKNLEGKADRSAYYECCLVQINPDGSELSAVGRVDGHILKEERGTAGFMYDALFYVDELGKTYGQTTMEEKNSTSHRGRAIQALKEKNLQNHRSDIKNL